MGLFLTSTYYFFYYFSVVLPHSWSTHVFQVRVIGEKDGKSHCFEIYTEGEGFVKGCKTDPSGTVVLATHKSYVLSADSAQKCSDWLTVIEESIKQNDPAIDHFHKVIEAKKSALRPKGHRTHTDVALTWDSWPLESAHEQRLDRTSVK